MLMFDHEEEWISAIRTADMLLVYRLRKGLKIWRDFRTLQAVKMAESLSPLWLLRFFRPRRISTNANAIQNIQFQMQCLWHLALRSFSFSYVCVCSKAGGSLNQSSLLRLSLQSPPADCRELHKAQVGSVHLRMLLNRRFL